MYFDIADILTVTKGKILSHRGIDAVYDITGFMLGYDVFTHELPSAAAQVTPEIFKQHPVLEKIEVPDFSGVDRDEIETVITNWVKETAETYGQQFDLTPMENVTPTDPIQSLVDLVGEDRVIIVGLN